MLADVPGDGCEYASGWLGLSILPVLH